MRVGIALYTLSGFPQDCLRGVAAFARPHRPWTFDYAGQSLEGVKGLLRQKPDGILVSSADQKVLHLLQDAGVPAVNMHYAATPKDLGHLRNDDVAVGKMAAAYFLQRAFTRFAYYCRTGDEQDERLEGFATELHAKGFACHSFDQAIAGNYDTQGKIFERKLAEWLQGLPKPIGLFCVGDHHAWIIAERCQRLGIRVPDEVAILGEGNDITLCALANPQLSSIQSAHERIGYEAAELLDQMMNGRAPKNLQWKVPPVRVVERRSTDGVAASDKAVAAALQYMKTHLIDSEGLLALCERLHSSRRALERKFTATTGISPAEAWTRFRVEEARRLLADTELPIAQVAEKAGFTDAKHLCLVFKKFVRETPRDFRRHASP